MLSRRFSKWRNDSLSKRFCLFENTHSLLSCWLKVHYVDDRNDEQLSKGQCPTPNKNAVIHDMVIENQSTLVDRPHNSLPIYCQIIDIWSLVNLVSFLLIQCFSLICLGHWETKLTDKTVAVGTRKAHFTFLHVR